MVPISFKILESKIIIRITRRICENPEELFSSALFKQVLQLAVKELECRSSALLAVFASQKISRDEINVLIKTFRFLVKMEAKLVPRVVPESGVFFRDKQLFNDFVEFLYNYWRSFERFVICDSAGGNMDKIPYRTFNNTIERLMHLIRAVYRDIQENITSGHPKIYRQVCAGAEVACIAVSRKVPYGDSFYAKLNSISIIRQVLLYPPLILEPSMNKRSGTFDRLQINPLEHASFNKKDWLCYPAKVGDLIILVYFHHQFAELGFALCNLFEIADEDDLARQPDAVYCFGLPRKFLAAVGLSDTGFYDDARNNMLVAAVAFDPQYGYFGYIKKMILTLHNVIMMKRGRMPFHGALVHLSLKGAIESTVLYIGDTGAGKSETLEALREVAGNVLQDVIIIADDMGSLALRGNAVLGYGTETGAFLRLDDLRPGYAFGQMDRAIIMNAGKVNARIVLPVTTFHHVSKGYKIDMVLYANNYEQVDAEHPIIERIARADGALKVFREGTVMSKGTTTSTGIVHSYFANVFGPAQYRGLHDKIASRFFNTFYKRGLFVGQIRTRLGMAGYEHNGPIEAARALLALIQDSALSKSSKRRKND
jgi:hypothetical protein